jgi:hypothetical protein
MPLEFWFDQVESGATVMHAPGIAVVFTPERGLTHAICIDSGPDILPSGRESWLVQSAGFSDQEMEKSQGRRIENPVYQELVRHELSDETRPGLCALLTGSSFNHHFSAVFSLYRDAETPRCIVLDVDVADRCRGPVEKLAATYIITGRALGAETTRCTAGSAGWRGAAARQGLFELIADPPATVDVSTGSSADIRAEIRAGIDPEIHTQRLRYRWRWASSSELTR